MVLSVKDNWKRTSDRLEHVDVPKRRRLTEQNEIVGVVRKGQSPRDGFIRTAQVAAKVGFL